MDFRQSKQFAGYLEFCGWEKVTLKNKSFIFVRKVPFLGSIVRIPRISEPVPFEEIEKTAGKYQAFLIKIEPDAKPAQEIFSKLKSKGYTKDAWSIEPTKTQIINLKQPMDKIFSGLKPKWRQYVRFAQKSGIKITKSNDVDSFIAVWQKNAQRKQRFVETSEQTKKFFEKTRKNNSLLFAEYNDQIIASAFLIFWKNTCVLLHLGYTGEYENFRPLYLLVWEAIQLAKKKGMHYFDFDGISDTRYPYSKSTQPTFFKQGFGGFEKEYAGSFVKYLKIAQSIPYMIISNINPGIFRRFVKKSYG